jgi:two-component system nitrogen regulation response regulator GlnG
MEEEAMSQPESARILIADDEESIRFVLREALESAGHAVHDVDNGDAALDALASGEYQIAFLDIRMPGPSGLELLERIDALGVDTAAVIITAQNTMENAVEAMKRGALDYLVKPFSLAAAMTLAEKALRTRTLQREVRELRREVGRSMAPGGERLVGRSPALLEIFKTIGKVAVRNVPVLVTGESGTGKELVANAIHASSPRADAPFVVVNAAAIPRELLESELFGHERGAFTGAVEARMGRFREASGGTLFLDEIGDMPIELQAKLLRVLQNGEVTSVGGRDVVHVDVRIIAATHRNLDEEVKKGNFREDLLYRLRVVPIEMPPLRERPEDISLLARTFVTRYAGELSEGPTGLADATLARLEAHDWPGNVRELENAIKRALVLHTGGVLTPDDFEFLTAATSAADGGIGVGLEELVAREVAEALDEPDPKDVYRSLLERVERPLLETVLSRTEGNQIRAAALLGINRNTLRKKIGELEIAVPSRGRP